MAQKNLLAVDDDADIRKLLEEQLSGTEYRCMAASGFQEAVELASAPFSEIDILLTDIILPPFQGRDLANRLVGLQPAMKVLFMSGYPLKLLTGHGLLPPHADYLAKPFSKNQLLQSLDAVSRLGSSWAKMTMVNFAE
ncbi:MAG TPA: response regulator [Fibrobacteria bacterium]|nr:response regulator [Fibrobacteria bacterium]